MANLKFQDLQLTSKGIFPKSGDKLPAFRLTNQDLSQITNQDFKDKNIILNIFPSIDTPTCSSSVRKFNELASTLNDTVILCVSADLPFAQKRFCAAEGIENVYTASTFQNIDFAENFGVAINELPFKGLLVRAVIVANRDGVILYAELVTDIPSEPNYELALASLTACA